MEVHMASPVRLKVPSILAFFAGKAQEPHLSANFRPGRAYIDGTRAATPSPQGRR